MIAHPRMTPNTSMLSRARPIPLSHRVGRRLFESPRFGNQRVDNQRVGNQRVGNQRVDSDGLESPASPIVRRLTSRV